MRINLWLVLVLFCFGCSEVTKENELPLPEPDFNPYTDIDYTGEEVEDNPIEPTSFLGLHNNIFSKSCNQPACHDGSFEPDFRTVQSAYASLVNHPVTKNYPTNPLQYRVQPGSTEASMMWHRLTMHNPPNFERMPSSGNPIPQEDLDNIEAWILGGAKDIFGDEPVQSSFQPWWRGVIAWLPDSGNFRLDTIRENVVNPFYVPLDQDVTMRFYFQDVNENQDTIFGNNLTFNKLKLSTNAFDFSDAVELDLTIEDPMTTYYYYSSIPSAEPILYYHEVTFNLVELGFEEGIVWMRTYVQDEDHEEPTELPTSKTEFIYLAHFAFFTD